MGEDDRRRRIFAAQGLAALALFVLAHGARAATAPQVAPHAPAVFQLLAK